MVKTKYSSPKDHDQGNITTPVQVILEILVTAVSQKENKGHAD